MLLLYGWTEVKNNLVLFSRSVVSNSLQPHRLQHARLPWPSPAPWACSNSCPSSSWCHPTISTSVVHFSSCPQSFPASGSFPVSQLLASSGQSIGASASASVLPVNIQGWFSLGLTALISLLSKGLSRWIISYIYVVFIYKKFPRSISFSQGFYKAGQADILFYEFFIGVGQRSPHFSANFSSAFGIAFLQFCLFLLPVTFVKWVSTQFFPC